MGRGRKWNGEERRQLALAWSRVSNDPIVGRNQTADTFALKVHEEFCRRAPKKYTPGTFADRTIGTCFNFFKQSISADVQKFNLALRKVYAANPTGVGEKEKVALIVPVTGLSIAEFSKTCNKTDQRVDAW